jgi:hypothetical protein
MHLIRNDEIHRQRTSAEGPWKWRLHGSHAVLGHEVKLRSAEFGRSHRRWGQGPVRSRLARNKRTY